MDQLIEGFSALRNSEMVSKIMAKAQSAMDRDMATQSKSISILPPDPKAGGSFFDSTDVDITDPARRTEFLKSITDSISKPLRFPPLDTLPCANVQVDKYDACNKPGTMACSECRLVSYCSKVASISVFFGHIFWRKRRDVRKRTGNHIKEVNDDNLIKIPSKGEWIIRLQKPHEVRSLDARLESWTSPSLIYY